MHKKLHYVRTPWEKVDIKPVATYKFAAPKTDKDVSMGRNNAQDMSKMPKGTVMGAGWGGEAPAGVGYVANQRRGLHK